MPDNRGAHELSKNDIKGLTKLARAVRGVALVAEYGEAQTKNAVWG